MKEKYDLIFYIINESPAVDSENYKILSNFLMYWDSPNDIVNNLIPYINKGIRYGTEDRFKAYSEISGLKEKMLRQWETRSIPNPNELWENIKNNKGYYIEEEDSFLEGIDADVIGSAFVTSDITVLSGSELNLKEMELSSEDFKEIIIEWLIFVIKNKMIFPTS